MRIETTLAKALVARYGCYHGAGDQSVIVARRRLRAVLEKQMERPLGELGIQCTAQGGWVSQGEVGAEALLAPLTVELDPPDIEALSVIHQAAQFPAALLQIPVFEDAVAEWGQDLAGFARRAEAEAALARLPAAMRRACAEQALAGGGNDGRR